MRRGASKSLWCLVLAFLYGCGGDLDGFTSQADVAPPEGESNEEYCSEQYPQFERPEPDSRGAFRSDAPTVGFTELPWIEAGGQGGQHFNFDLMLTNFSQFSSVSMVFEAELCDQPLGKDCRQWSQVGLQAAGVDAYDWESRANGAMVSDGAYLVVDRWSDERHMRVKVRIEGPCGETASVSIDVEPAQMNTAQRRSP